MKKILKDAMTFILFMGLAILVWSFIYVGAVCGASTNTTISTSSIYGVNTVGEFDDFKGRTWQKSAGGWLVNIELVPVSYIDIEYTYNDKKTEMKPVVKRGNNTIRREIKKCPICNRYMHFKNIIYADRHQHDVGFKRKDYIVINSNLEVHPKCWERHITKEIKGLR